MGDSQLTGHQLRLDVILKWLIASVTINPNTGKGVFLTPYLFFSYKKTACSSKKSQSIIIFTYILHVLAKNCKNNFHKYACSTLGGVGVQFFSRYLRVCFYQRKKLYNKIKHIDFMLVFFFYSFPLFYIISMHFDTFFFFLAILENLSISKKSENLTSSGYSNGNNLV